MSNFKIQIGKRIAELRTEKGIKRETFIEMLDGPTLQMLSNWENGHTTPSAFYLVKIAEVLDTTVDYILTGKKNSGFSHQINTYKDILVSVNDLIVSGMFTKSIYEPYGKIISVQLSSNNKTIGKYIKEYESLEGARKVIGDEVFNNELTKLINKYAFSIEKKD